MMSALTWLNPHGFPVGTGGLDKTQPLMIVVAPNMQAIADELRNYGKRPDSLQVVAILTDEDVRIARMTLPGYPWCAVDGAPERLKRDMGEKNQLNFAKCIGLVNDQYAIAPRKLMGIPTK